MSPPRPSRELVRGRDGRLFDVGEHRAVDIDELAEDVRAGLRFRAREQHSGQPCTQRVLLEVLCAAAPTPAAPSLPSVGTGLAAVMTLARDAMDRRDRDRAGPEKADPHGVRAAVRRGGSGMPVPTGGHVGPGS